MDERLRNWHPRPDEVARIVAEMRPVIRAVVKIEQARAVTDALCACAVGPRRFADAH